MIRPAFLAAACWLAFSVFSVVALADELPEPAPIELPASITVQTPEGWSLLPGLSRTVSQSASETDFFGELEAFDSGAMAYGRANRGAFYLTWVDSLRTQPVAENSVRLAFDELHQAPYLASPEAGVAQEVSYRERIFDGVAEVRFEWAHMSNGTVNVVRALGWKDGDARVHLAIAECVLQSESIAQSRPLCEATLESLALTKKSAHETLASLPEPKATFRKRPEDFEVPKLETNEMLPTDSLGAAPSEMGEVLYQGPPKTKADDNNRFIIAIGVLLLGVAFFLTTRSSSTDAESAEEDEENQGGDEAEEDETDEDSRGDADKEQE